MQTTAVMTNRTNIEITTNIELTEGVGRHALRMASELECRGVYFGSCKIGCILKACLLFMDIMMAEVREGRLSPFCPNAISASDRSAKNGMTKSGKNIYARELFFPG